MTVFADEKRMCLYAALTAGIAVFAPGCATVFSSPTAEVSLHSEPSGAKVTVNGESKGRTPTTVELSKTPVQVSNDESHTITFEKAGYETETRELESERGPLWLILDFAGFPVAHVVDMKTGAWYELEEETVHAKLTKSEGSDGGGSGRDIVIVGARRVSAPDHLSDRPALAPFHPAEE